MALDASGKRLPWFKMWTRDFMADPVVQGLSWEQRGRYLWALLCSWETDTPGEAPEEAWAGWMGYGSDADRGKFLVMMGLFKPHPDREGFLIQSKMLREYEISREERARHTLAGRRGAEKRWMANAGLMRGHMDTQCGANGISEVRSQKSETEESKTCPEPPAHGPMELPAIGGATWTPSPKQERELRLAYPSVDMEAEFGKMRAWLATNPTRQKTHRGLPRFANQWLSRAQESHKPAEGATDGWYD